VRWIRGAVPTGLSGNPCCLGSRMRRVPPLEKPRIPIRPLGFTPQSAVQHQLDQVEDNHPDQHVEPHQTDDDQGLRLLRQFGYQNLIQYDQGGCMRPPSRSPVRCMLSGLTSCSAATKYRRNRSGSLSRGSSESQAWWRERCASHCAAKVVLPKPAPEEIRVILFSSDSSRRAHNRGRSIAV